MLLTHQPATSSHRVCVSVSVFMGGCVSVCVCVYPRCLENTSLHCLLKLSVSPPEPAFLPENFKKKDVVEILSHKKAYNACEYENMAACRTHKHTPIHTHTAKVAQLTQASMLLSS